MLGHVLRLFAVGRPPAVVAWSAGAMALTERVMLFHDRAAHGPSHAEFADVGLGWVPGAVLLPHARRRLRVDDPAGWRSWPCARRPPDAWSSTTASASTSARTAALPPDALVVSPTAPRPDGGAA